MCGRFLFIAQDSLLPESGAVLSGANSTGEEGLAESSDKDDDVETGELLFLTKSFQNSYFNFL